MFSIQLQYSFYACYVSCGPHNSLLKHNEADIELQIWPCSINKQDRDTLVACMFDHFLAPEGGHPTWEEHFI